MTENSNSEKTTVQDGAALYAAKNKGLEPSAQPSGSLAKGRAIYAARTTKGVRAVDTLQDGGQ